MTDAPPVAVEGPLCVAFVPVAEGDGERRDEASHRL
jgi:hypothetical protein